MSEAFSLSLILGSLLVIPAMWAVVEVVHFYTHIDETLEFYLHSITLEYRQR